MANLLHGQHYKYTDAMRIYRAFRKHVIYDLELHVDDPYELPERLFRTIVSWEPLMSVRALKKKMKIDELPVCEPKRISGKRKLQPFKWGRCSFSSSCGNSGIGRSPNDEESSRLCRIAPSQPRGIKAVHPAALAEVIGTRPQIAGGGYQLR